MADNCQGCLKHNVYQPEPLCPTPFSERSWLEFRIDFFQGQSLDYLIAVDFSSRFTEIAAMNKTREVVKFLGASR